MSEDRTDDIKKPDEILELEVISKMNLGQAVVTEDRIETFLLEEESYFIDSAGRVIGLSFFQGSFEDVTVLAKFKSLKKLNLTQNKIKDISALAELKELSCLYLGGNNIENIEVLANLTNLKDLKIWSNPISDISPISKLIKLSVLHCEDIKLKDLSFLSCLTHLKELSISENEITDISIFKELNIADVFLVRNSVKKIPEEIAEKYSWLANSVHKDRNAGKSLLISYNPLEFPPLSVIELGSDIVKSYYGDAREFGHASLSEGRIIFIGDGSAGKSSVIEKTLYGTFTLGREQTNGIKIENFSLEHPEDKRKLQFHIWDFGGQEIQHAVHKFFFTEGCVYVLVLDNRKEEEPEYWLQQIESLGGKAPVLVVFNKQDENAAETADRKFLKEKYPNIIGFYTTSCATGFGIEDFKNSLYAEVVKLRTVSEQFPNNWLAVKKAIEENISGAQHYLTYETYKEICKQNHLVTEEAQKLLLRYFNTIGTVTWFGDDAYLQFLHVLNPAWITQGVYKILTAKKTAYLQGQIRVDDFKELLVPLQKDEYTYDEAHYGYILSMMKKFSLCYTSDDKNLLIPSAFGKVPKAEYSDFRGEGIRTYILQFKDYMPLALIHRFTAQKMPQAFENNYWYTGIVIKDNKTDALAMVHADKEAKRIYIRIKGESKLGIWEHVRRDLALIASSYASIPYDELVELDEKSASTVNYEDVVSHVKAQKFIYFHPRLQKDFNVGYLMSLFEPKESTTDKILKGEISLRERESNMTLEKLPPFVLNILNNNSPVVNTQVNTQVNIDLTIVNDISSNVKGDAQYLLELLGGSNKAFTEALQKIVQFADDAKAARNTGDIKEKGWGRKLKNIVETLGKSGEDLKNISDGGEVLKSIFEGMKKLAGHFNLDSLLSVFQ